MRKIIVVLAALSSMLILFLFCLIFFGGGASQPLASDLATPEKTIEYVDVCSRLGAPWEIVLLTDSIYAQREDAGNVENINPMVTGLQFLKLTVTEETLETVTDGQGRHGTQWTVAGRTSYTGADAILEEAGLKSVEGMTPETLIAKIKSAVANRSTATHRYSADLSPNHDFKGVLKNYTTLTPDEQSAVLSLYDADYLLLRLDEDTQNRVRQLMATNGMYQKADMSDYSSCEGVIFTGGATRVVYYNQLDPRWADAPFGTDQIGPEGCGPTSMSIVISSLTSETRDPVYMAQWAYEHGYWAKGAGSYHSLIPGAAEAFGLHCTGSSDPQEIVKALENGGLVVALMGQGHFTSTGHFMVLRGVDNGKIMVADPASYDRTNQTWDLSLILAESIHSAGAGGPFWIITK